MSECASNSRSTITANAHTAFQIENANALTIEGVRIVGGSAIAKSGKGDLTVTNCVIGELEGRGITVTGTSPATVRLVDSLFTQAFTIKGAGNGGAASFTSVARVFIDNCDFVTNGCPFSIGYEPYGYAQNGAAIHANNAPLTIRNTRFKGNRSQALWGVNFLGTVPANPLILLGFMGTVPRRSEKRMRKG